MGQKGNCGPGTGQKDRKGLLDLGRDKKGLLDPGRDKKGLLDPGRRDGTKRDYWTDWRVDPITSSSTVNTECACRYECRTDCEPIRRRLNLIYRAFLLHILSERVNVD
jgi:hypothetical protein